MLNRRNFIRQTVAAGVACNVPFVLFSQQKPVEKMIWADLIHLRYNFWGENVLHPKYQDENFKCSTCGAAREWEKIASSGTEQVLTCLTIGKGNEFV
jgi:hypothetical protein